jgi:hypothetical protein
MEPAQQLISVTGEATSDHPTGLEPKVEPAMEVTTTLIKKKKRKIIEKPPPRQTVIVTLSAILLRHRTAQTRRKLVPCSANNPLPLRKPCGLLETGKGENRV